MPALFLGHLGVSMALVAERGAAIRDGSYVVEINDEEPVSS